MRSTHFGAHGWSELEQNGPSTISGSDPNAAQTLAAAGSGTPGLY